MYISLSFPLIAIDNTPVDQIKDYYQFYGQHFTVIWKFEPVII